MTTPADLLDRLDRMLTRAEKLFGGQIEAPDWTTVPAALWRTNGTARYLQAVNKPHKISLDDLQGIDGLGAPHCGQKRPNSI